MQKRVKNDLTSKKKNLCSFLKAKYLLKGIHAFLRYACQLVCLRAKNDRCVDEVSIQIHWPHQPTDIDLTGACMFPGERLANGDEQYEYILLILNSPKREITDLVAKYH